MLKLVFIWVGKTKETWLRNGVQNYLERIYRYVSVQVKECKEKKYSPKMGKKAILNEEGERLLRAVPKGAFCIVLDERGKMFKSEELASFITRLENQGTRDIAVISGGPLGLSREVIKSADLILSLSRLTFPHDLARLIIAEQFYRAFTIKAGEPYHH